MKNAMIILLVCFGLLFGGCDLIELVADYQVPDSSGEDTEDGIDGGSDADTGNDNIEMGCNGDNFAVGDGGYVCAGPLHGYAWTSSENVDGASIAPDTFSDIAAGESLCVQGVTAASYDSVGILGVNANQEIGRIDIGAWSPQPDNTGLSVSVTQEGTFTMRLYIVTEDRTHYCTDISDGTTIIDFGDLQTECWSDEGEPYNGIDAIKQVMIVVPGEATNKIAYGFCLNELIFTVGNSNDSDVDTDIDTETSHIDTGIFDTDSTNIDTGIVDTVCDGVTYRVEDSGYVCAGPLHGYAWTHTEDGYGASIAPDDFSDIVAGESLCVQGVTAASYESISILGINANQEPGQVDNGASSPDPNNTGMSVSITRNGSFTLRLDIITEDRTHYCTDISDGTTTVDFGDLRSECWSNDGEPYNGIDAIEQVALLVPGNGVADVAYSFCLNELVFTTSSDTDIDTDIDTETTDIDTGIIDTDTTNIDTGEVEMSCDGSSYAVKDGAYVCAGELHGYAWTNAGETRGAFIEPEDFSDIVAGDSLCVQGVTAASYDSVGILGVNANQEMGMAEFAGAWSPGTGETEIQVSVSRHGDFTVQLYIVTEDQKQYCAYIAEGINIINLEDLRTECWSDEGESYNGTEAIARVMFVVPGEESTEIDYDFCLDELMFASRDSNDADNGMR